MGKWRDVAAGTFVLAAAGGTAVGLTVLAVLRLSPAPPPDWVLAAAAALAGAACGYGLFRLDDLVPATRRLVPSPTAMGLAIGGSAVLLRLVPDPLVPFALSFAAGTMAVFFVVVTLTLIANLTTPATLDDGLTEEEVARLQQAQRKASVTDPAVRPRGRGRASPGASRRR